MPDGKPSAVPIATEPRTLHVGLHQALVDAGCALGERHRQQVLDTEGEVLTKSGHARTDDRDLSHAATRSGSNM
jgi:hypothetical protein